MHFVKVWDAYSFFCLFIFGSSNLELWSVTWWLDARWLAWFCYLLVDYGGNASHMQKQQVESSGPVQLSKFLGRDKDDGVRRSAVSGKKILLKLDKTKEDKEAESKRNELLKFLNASYDWLLKPKSWCKFPARSGKCWSSTSSSISVLIVYRTWIILPFLVMSVGWIQPPVLVQYHASAFLLLPVWDVCESTMELSSHIWVYIPYTVMLNFEVFWLIIGDLYGRKPPLVSEELTYKLNSV